MTKAKSKSAPPAPDYLSAKSKALWAEVATAEVKAARLALIEQGLASLDRADEARALIAEQGMVSEPTKRTGMQHLNPLLRVEQQNRAQFVATFSALGLRW